MTTNGRFLPRRLGDFLLVTQLAEDALGTVYRALHSSDEGRFVRLRTLQSPELSPDAVAAAIQKRKGAPALSHKTIALREELDVAEGVPYLAWYESGGWTLDFVAARLRAETSRIPPEYALLIGQQLSSALEHAWFSGVDGEPTRHGLVWPGFVSVSMDAEIRLGGFGLADAILPSLHKPRLAREIAPYLPPEARATGVCGENSDVYSVGAVLLELMTGHHPSVDAEPRELPDDDPFRLKIGDFIRRCFAPPAERFSSTAEMNRALRELLAGSPAPLSMADLAVFFYELLNPESRRTPPAVDLDSTNPVPEPSTPPVEDNGSTSEASTPAPGVLASSGSRAASAPWITKWKAERLGVKIFPVARIAAAALATIGVAALLLLSTRRAPRASSVERDRPTLVARESPSTSSGDLSTPSSSGDFSPASEAASVRRHSGSTRAIGPRGSSGRAVLAAASKQVVSETRSAAEGSRLQAGLARVHAESLEARELAGEPFAEARQTEETAEALLRGGDYGAAQSAFDRAAGLFRDAEARSREERVRRIRIASD